MIDRRRIHLTQEQIENQQKNARLGTLVHWVLAKKCERKRLEQDVRSEGRVKFTATATFYGNITCLACRKEAWANGVRP